LNGYVYFQTWNSPSPDFLSPHFVRFRLSDFTRDETIKFWPEFLTNCQLCGKTLPLGADGNGFAYFGINSGSYQAGVVKARLPSLEIVDTLMLDSRVETPSCGVVDASGGFVYIGTHAPEMQPGGKKVGKTCLNEILGAPPRHQHESSGVS
jgi:hypothetical protein